MSLDFLGRLGVALSATASSVGTVVAVASGEPTEAAIGIGILCGLMFGVLPMALTIWVVQD